MRRHLVVVGCLLGFTGLAVAQGEAPRQEVYLGYDMLRANSARGIPAFTANGAGGQYAYNFNRWIGGVADIYAVHNGNVFGSVTDPKTGITYPGGKIDQTAVFYQFGPRITYRGWSRVSIFGDILLGAGSGAVSVPVRLPAGSTINVNTPSGIYTITPGAPGQKGSYGVRLKSNQTFFAYKLGGGLDWKINKHLSFRPIEADLQFTRLAEITQTQTTRSQYNFLYSTGFTFTFGSAQ